jgi:hypothetical protein
VLEEHGQRAVKISSGTAWDRRTTPVLRLRILVRYEDALEVRERDATGGRAKGSGARRAAHWPTCNSPPP